MRSKVVQRILAETSEVTKQKAISYGNNLKLKTKLMDKEKIENDKISEANIMNSASFKKFKDAFLSNFIFKPIKRPEFNHFLLIHFRVYEIVYKNFYSIKQYSKIALKEDLIEFEKYGVQLKKKQR